MEPLTEAVWADILGHVRAQHPDLARGWFAQLRPESLTGGELTVHMVNEAQLAYLETRCRRAFVEAIQAATGRLVGVRFALRAGAPGDPAVDGGLAQQTSAQADGAYPAVRLNPEYSFEHFVTGPGNQLAHAGAVAISEGPGNAYNPFFVHGSVGLGKTHLLQAVCLKVLQVNPNGRALYLSCEAFVNQFIEAVERGALDSFRYRYRHADVLAVDDVQFLAGRDQIQEEFFHTFNTLHQARKQILLSADCSPTAMSSLEERLVSRFNWGLVARIDPPSLETRLAIVRKKARLRGIEMPDDAAMLIATRVKSNIRELEGALTKIHGISKLSGGPIDAALARRALGEEEATTPRPIQIRDIMGAVSERFGVRLTDMQGRRRTRSIALPRQVCMYLARELTPHSLEEIGGFFGGRDHTTVLHAHTTVAKRRGADAELRSRIDEIESALRGSPGPS